MSLSEPPRVPRPRLIGAALTIYWIALFVGTHLPEPEQFLPPDVSDKWLHFLAYCGLAFALALWWSVSHAVTVGRLIRLFVIVAVYGAADELLQSLPVVNRQMEFYDWLMDVAGAAAGLILFRVARGTIARCWTARDVR